tara:strand:+ start:179 stop:814 length:636 start_codon:yes stop_codon:yes gene_type:complete
MTNNKNENTIDQTIINNTTKEFVKTFVTVEKIMDQFNNKRWFQFCQIANAYNTFNNKVDSKKKLRASIRKTRETIKASYLNDVFRSCNDKIQSLIINTKTVEEVQKTLLEHKISCYEDFKNFVNPKKVLTAKEKEKIAFDKSNKAKETQDNTLENKMRDKSQIRSEEQNIAFVLEFVEEKFSDKSAVLLAQMIIKKHGEIDAKQELKTASK